MTTTSLSALCASDVEHMKLQAETQFVEISTPPLFPTMNQQENMLLTAIQKHETERVERILRQVKVTKKIPLPLSNQNQNQNQNQNKNNQIEEKTKTNTSSQKNTNLTQSTAAAAAAVASTTTATSSSSSSSVSSPLSSAELLPLSLSSRPLLHINLPLSPHGGTFLHISSQLGQERIVKLLLKYGRNPNSLSLNGSTPLHWAAGAGQVETSTLLLQHGSDPTKKTTTWRSSVFGKGSGQTPAHWAAESGHTQVLHILHDFQPAAR